MTVQRQYTLPNCNLKLEGLSSGDEMDPSAPLTVVLNSECTFPENAETLSGGRDFLNALIKSVSSYAQSILSGIPYPIVEETSEATPVTLQASDDHRHQLTAIVPDNDGKDTRKTVVLNTVQLFDLMEAVDQLLADSLTLPDMTLQLSSLHRRHARPTEPKTQRLMPAAVGVSALAASAALLFMVPVPEFEPQRTEERGSTTLVEEESSGESSSITSPPEDIEDAEEDAETGDAAEAENSEVAEITPSATDPISAATALARLQTAPEITDEDTLDELGEDLTASLEDSLSEDVEFEESLVYRVAVSESGDILGYKYENDAALTEIDNTPLPELVFLPVDEDATEEPVAQFRVTFETDGEVVTEPITPEDEDDE